MSKHTFKGRPIEVISQIADLLAEDSNWTVEVIVEVLSDD